MSAVNLINNSTFAGMPPEHFVVLGIDGLVGRVFGLPPELLPACGRCGAPTVIDSAIRSKYVDYKYLGERNPARVRAWCIQHVPRRIRFRDWLNRMTERPHPRLHPETRK